MKLHDSFASEEFLRYAAECERMARLAVPIKRKTARVRNFALLPLGVALLAHMVAVVSS